MITKHPGHKTQISYRLKNGNLLLSVTIVTARHSASFSDVSTSRRS